MPTAPSKDIGLDRLSEALSRLTTNDEKASTIVSYISDVESAPTSTGAGIFDSEEFNNLLESHGLSHFDVARAIPSRAKFALERIPCAYINANTGEECLKDGTAACTNCRLVLYCSKVGDPPLYHFLWIASSFILGCHRSAKRDIGSCIRKVCAFSKRLGGVRALIDWALDCKSYLRSKDWEPGWVEEQRAPIFVTGTPRNSSFSRGMAL